MGNKLYLTRLVLSAIMAQHKPKIPEKETPPKTLSWDELIEQAQKNTEKRKR